MKISRRKALVAGASFIAAPALLTRRGYAVEQRSIKIGSVLTGTTMAGEIMIKYLKEVGVEAEVLQFPNITQRMQAVAADTVQVGYAGINAAILLASKGVPLQLLANACDGGWSLVGKPEFKTLQSLRGKKIAVQPGNICHIALAWKLKSLGMTKDVELVFLNNNDMPTPLAQGQIDAMFSIEPYPSFAKENGWGVDIWDGYDTPMKRRNLGFVASRTFVEKNPVLTREMVKAHIRATKDLMASSSVAAETISRVLNLPRSITDASLKNTFFSIETGEEYNKEIVAMGDMMKDAAMLDSTPDWKTFINTSFL
jgi:ABC-type nitrate/sulfonate/bicarbonate transport system substrate-binding protein